MDAVEKDMKITLSQSHHDNRGNIELHKTALKIVFSNPIYLVMSISISALMLIILLHAREFLFFAPYFAFQLPSSMILSFVLIVIVSGLTGIVSAMSAFQIYTQRTGVKNMSSGVIGSFAGVGTGICTSCSQIGFTIISALGATGAAALSFLTYYEIQIRVASIVLLAVSYFLVAKNIGHNCKINPNN